MEFEVTALIANLRSWVESHLDWVAIRDFGNSTFFTSIAGAFAGAWAGGRIAQVLATRARDKEELAKEIRKANAAAIMSSSLCDDLGALLRQHVKPMKEQYDKDLALMTALLATPAKPSGRPPTICANLMQLSGPTLHVENLEQLVFGEISNNRAIRLFTTLSQTVSNVESMVVQRNLLVEEFRAVGNTQTTLRYSYFGFPTAHGEVDGRYKTTLDSLHTNLWDGIYFSMQLALLLADHAAEIERRFKRSFGRSGPKAIAMEFSLLKERGIMPDRNNYPDWEALLNKPARQTTWERLRKRLDQLHAKCNEL